MQLTAHWTRLIAGCAVVLAAAVVLPRFVKAPYLNENRTLAEAPHWTLDPQGFTGFRKQADAYVADHFPSRPHLIGLLNLLRYRLGVSGSPRVIVGGDGWLFYDNGSHMAAADGTWRLGVAEEKAWLRGLAGRTEALRARGAAYLVVVPPDKEEVYPQHGPSWFHLDPDRNAVRLSRLARASQAGEVLYLAPLMARPARWGLKLYDRYETHWTGLGAYEGYAALMQRLQAMGAVHEGPRPLEAFTEKGPGEAMAPNLAMMLGIASFVHPDFPQFDDPAAERQLKTTYLTPAGDWTRPQVVDTGQAGKPVLLMTRDSFSTALLPFLYGHFSRIVLAHIQDGPWRQDLIDQFKPDVVVLEVLESGMPFMLDGGPEASPQALARIEAVLKAPPKPAPAPAAAGLTPFALRPDETVPAATPGKVIEGGPADECLDGTAGDDRISGRGGNDTLHGLGGDDVIRGGKGDDVIDGGDGDDWISGDRGDDTLTGGHGADTFHSSADAGLDLVTDFTPGDGDRIELDPGTAFTIAQEGPDTVIHMRGARLVLKNVKAASLPRDAIHSR
ncbi:MAG TPA: hypothetical protein VHV27_03615 [Phenylobacterium sp.]|nr:hypothetical protein [Phenylobacterium sp.]